MYLTDLTDAQKEYIKGTILMDNWDTVSLSVSDAGH